MISADTLELLMKGGFHGEALLEVVRSIERDKKPRTNNAERQARHREKKKAEQTEPVTNNVTSNALLPSPLVPPFPPAPPIPPIIPPTDRWVCLRRGGSETGGGVWYALAPAWVRPVPRHAAVVGRAFGRSCWPPLGHSHNTLLPACAREKFRGTHNKN